MTLEDRVDEAHLTSDPDVYRELIDWLTSTQPLPAEIFINHGEPEAAAALAERIERDLDVIAVVPESGERVIVGS